MVSCMTFDTEEEAVQLANDSDFGLAAAVLSKVLDLSHSRVQVLNLPPYRCYPQNLHLNICLAFKLPALMGRESRSLLEC